MSPAASSFSITGGTVPPGTLSSVTRQADRDLYEALLRGKWGGPLGDAARPPDGRAVPHGASSKSAV
jgi:hypothetical protein